MHYKFTYIYIYMTLFLEPRALGYGIDCSYTYSAPKWRPCTYFFGKWFCKVATCLGLSASVEPKPKRFTHVRSWCPQIEELRALSAPVFVLGFKTRIVTVILFALSCV